MPIRFSCPCGEKLKTRDDTVGKRAKCPHCGRSLVVPQSDTYTTVAHESAKKIEAPAPGTPDHRPAGHAKATVLVADSVAGDREHTANVLRQHGYEVIQAGDGAAALDMIRHFHPLAAILNIHLNELSGFQVVQQLRNLSNPMNKDVFDTPVLITAEKLHGRDRQYAMHLGVEGFFTKPVVAAELCAKLEKVIAKYHPHVQ